MIVQYPRISARGRNTIEDTHFVKNTIENRFDIIANNHKLYHKKIITDIGIYAILKGRSLSISYKFPHTLLPQKQANRSNT